MDSRNSRTNGRRRPRLTSPSSPPLPLPASALLHHLPSLPLPLPSTFLGLFPPRRLLGELLGPFHFQSCSPSSSPSSPAPIPMNFRHVPSRRACPLPKPHWLRPCPAHQNSPSSFFTSRASRHSPGSASQRGQLGRPGCEVRAGGAERPPPPRCIPPVTPGPSPLHAAPRVPQPQQPHFGEAQRHLRVASSVGVAPGQPLPAHP